MKTNDQHDFLSIRQDFEKQYFQNLDESDIISSISSIDITTIDLCNRTCVFCPRHDSSVYPNRNLKMTAEGALTISRKIKEINFKGTIAISGFGENLLNPDIADIIKVIKDNNPEAFVECNTNGDPLNSSIAESLIAAGLDRLNVNLYDGPEQIEEFDKILKNISEDKYKYRVHWDESDHGIIFNNRSGVISWMHKDNVMQNKPCYYPFYKLFIDWNGDVLFCANDWGRTRVVGNLMQQDIREVWFSSEMKKIRTRLSKSNRNFKPCQTCDVDGTLVGKHSFDMIMNYYENSDNRK